MSTITVKEATAGSAVGTNLLAGHREQIRPVFRRVSRIGVVGAATIGAASLDVFYGNVYIGTFFNTTSGANVVPVDAKDMMRVTSSLAAEPNEPINLLISAVGVTNVLVATMEIEELA